MRAEAALKRTIEEYTCWSKRDNCLEAPSIRIGFMDSETLVARVMAAMVYWSPHSAKQRR